MGFGVKKREEETALERESYPVGRMKEKEEQFIWHMN